ncbi:MAG: amidophosphoribosyltransferase, partial [Thermoleophilia bacterium]|nr:amidophosphoribosyltransferase [Thermoleophilia bacterium]
DMANQDEFIAFDKSVEEVSRELGATSVYYLSLPGLMKATGVGDEETSFCAACFNGSYPCEVPEELRSSKFRFEDGGAARA